MPTLKAIEMSVGDRNLVVQVSNKRTVILRGSLSLDVLFTVECLLANDFTGYYRQSDLECGLGYTCEQKMAKLLFTDGVITGRDGAVVWEGEIPKIHCVRYVGGRSDGIRSFLITGENSGNMLGVDLTHYSNALDQRNWFRLVSVVNGVVGYEMCQLRGSSLNFDFRDNCGLDVEHQKLVYMLLSECFLTLEKYNRVVLIPDIPGMNAEKQIKLLQAIQALKGHSLTLTALGVDFSDFAVMLV